MQCLLDDQVQLGRLKGLCLYVGSRAAWCAELAELVAVVDTTEHLEMLQLIVDCHGGPLPAAACCVPAALTKASLRKLTYHGHHTSPTDPRLAFYLRGHESTLEEVQ